MISNNSKKITSALLLFIGVFFFTAPAFSADAWYSEFEEICSKTDDSGAMNKEELKSIIERCDKLRPVVEKSDNPQKNVILFRLDKCKKLFLYVLEVSEN